MFTSLIHALAADLLGTRKAARVSLDLRPAALLARSRLAAAAAVGRDALRALAGVAALCAAAAVVAAPMLWEVVR